MSLAMPTETAVPPATQNQVAFKPKPIVSAELTDSKETFDIGNAQKEQPKEEGEKDGGFFAWLQCLAGCILMFNSWGINYSYGVFQTYYQLDILRYENPSNLSWIGSLQTFFLLFGGLIVGPLVDKGHLRSIITVGGFFVVLGIMLASVSYQYWHFILAQGIVVGLGCACLFNPGVAIIPQYFQKRRNLALGLSASGSSLGGIIYPIIFNQLLPRLGFGWSCRIVAFVVLATMLFPIAIMRRRDTATGALKKMTSDPGAWKEIPYVMVTIYTFFGFLGLLIPFYYTELFGISLGYVDANLSTYLVPLLNAGSFFGRLAVPYIADLYRAPLNVAIISNIGMSVVGMCWIAINGEASIIVFCILFGFFSGAFVALGPGLIASITKDMRYFGIRVGMLLAPTSFAVLIGNPIAGAALRQSWLALQLFCGTMIILSLVACIGAKLFIRLRSHTTKRQSV